MSIVQRSRSMLTHVILIPFAVLMVYPVLWVAASSLKSQQDMYSRPWGLPKTLLFSNYAEAWSIGRIGECYLNSVIVAAGSLFLIAVITYLASYALARIRFRAGGPILILFIATMMLPTQATIIPIYKIERILGLIDTLPGLIIPYVAKALPFSIFVLTAFLKSIPIEFDEAAKIDGAGRLKTLLTVIAPLSRPGLSTIIIINFLSIWNDFYLPLVLIHDPDRKTLNLGLANFSQLWGRVDFTRLFAALVIISVPLIIVYVFFQRQFISGLTSGGLKT